MTKLTSSDISWGDNMYIALVSNNNLEKYQYPAQDVSEANDRYYIGSNWSLMSEYYIVYRKSEPVKKTVVDAVNYFKGDFSKTADDENEDYSQVIMAMKDFDGYEKGELQGGNSVSGNKYWSLICTIEQFNQCVKELSEASWMNDGEPMFYHVYKQAFNDVEAMKNVTWTLNTPVEVKANCAWEGFNSKPSKLDVLMESNLVPEMGEYVFNDTKPTYKYEKVTDLDLNGIAKAMIDGEVFYGENGANRYLWENGQFTDKYDGGCFVCGDYYREIEVIDTRTPQQKQLGEMVQFTSENLDLPLFTLFEEMQKAGMLKEV